MAKELYDLNFTCSVGCALQTTPFMSQETILSACR